MKPWIAKPCTICGTMVGLWIENSPNKERVRSVEWGVAGVGVFAAPRFAKTRLLGARRLDPSHPNVQRTHQGWVTDQTPRKVNDGATKWVLAGRAGDRVCTVGI